MPPYKCPVIGDTLDVKFVRIKRDIFVGKNRFDHHRDIVKLDNLEELILNMLRENPDEVDAGWVGVKDYGVIFVIESSTTLRLPLPGHEEKAREITKRDFAEQSQNHNVLGFRK